MFGATILHYSRVKNDITEEDEEYLEKIFLEYGVEKRDSYSSFEEEIETIRSIQQAVLSISPLDEGIPKGQTREPKDLYNGRRGLCYDRSRVIEKALRVVNLPVRHASVFSIDEGSPCTEKSAFACRFRGKDAKGLGRR